MLKPSYKELPSQDSLFGVISREMRLIKGKLRASCSRDMSSISINDV